MRVLSLTLLLCAACGKNESKAKEHSAAQGEQLSEDEAALVSIAQKYAAELGEHRDTLCACKDEACVEKVDQLLDAVSVRYMEYPVPPSVDGKLREIGHEIIACRERIGATYRGLHAVGDSVQEQKAMEAEQLLRKLHAGLRLRLEEGGTEPLPKSAGPQPPLGTCCKEGGTCAPDPSRWEGPEWDQVFFAISFPSHFSYEYRREKGENARFDVYAYGDLDCDNSYSTYHMSGEYIAEEGGYDSLPVMERIKALE